MVLETAGLNVTELGAHCSERGLFPEHVARWRQAEVVWFNKTPEVPMAAPAVPLPQTA
ncbi:hypothetical protein NZK32_06225 [Cyanobium sp. FGCU-52]|nr:hypothetical protein [Cyanobium sp. FGCU52]